MIRYQLCYYLPHRSAVRSVGPHVLRQTDDPPVYPFRLPLRQTHRGHLRDPFHPESDVDCFATPSSSCPSNCLRVTALIFSSITKIITVIPNKFSSMCFIQYVKGGEQRVSEAPRGEQERAFSSCDMPPPSLSVLHDVRLLSLSYVMHMTLHFSSEPSRHS